MRVLVEGHVPAWCYVDTDTGEVELIEVWAWEEEFSFKSNEDVIAEHAADEGAITRHVARVARRFAHDNCGPAPFTVAFDLEQTLLERRIGARVGQAGTRAEAVT